MRAIPLRLGPRLNLFLLAFALILGSATTGLIVFGFERTQDDATSSSREALEDAAQRALQENAAVQSAFGQAQLEATAGFAQQAARYMTDERAPDASFDGARLARAPAGQLYDSDPGRVTDVYLPSFAALDEAALRDLRDSASLDALLPTLLAGLTGEQLSPHFDAAAIYFDSVHNVTRAYPRFTDVAALAPDRDVRTAIGAAGPEQNPTRAIVWTAPHLDDTGRGQVVTARVPVYDGDEFRGAMSVDLRVHRLVQQVDAVKPTRGGYAFYVDREGRLLETASYATVQAGMDDPANEGFARAIAEMRQGRSGVDRAVLGGREVFVAYAPLGDVGGSFALVAPVEEVTSQAGAVQAAIDDGGRRTIVIVLASMAALFVVALAFSSWLNIRTVLRPVGEMVAGTRALAAGDLNAEIPVRSNDELGVLAASFNGMVTVLRERTDALRVSEAELSALFAAMTDVVLVLDREGRYQRVAPTRSGATLTPRDGLAGKSLHEVMPTEQAERFVEPIRRALDLGEPQELEYSLQVDGDERWYAAAISPMDDDTVVVVAHDVTERVAGERLLEEGVAQRTRELAALLDVSHAVASKLELRPLVAVVLEQLRRVVEYNGASVVLLEGDDLVIVPGPGAAADPERPPMRFPVSAVPVWEDLQAGRHVIIDDVLADSSLARAYRAATGPRIETAFRHVRAWMGVPIAHQGVAAGMLAISHGTPGFFSDAHARIVRAVADQAAVAIENARLYAETERRGRELAALLDVTRSVASTLDLRSLLELILDEVNNAAPFQRGAFLLLEGGDLTVIAARDRVPERAEAALRQRFPVGALGRLWEVISRGEELIIDDVHGESEAARAYRSSVAVRFEDSYADIRSWMAVPVMRKGRLEGVLAVARGEAGFYTRENARLARAIADQAAVAVENARLYAQTEQRARETQALLRADAELFRSLSLEGVFQALCDVVVDLLGADKCMVTTINDEMGRYTIRASRNLTAESLERMLEIRQRQPRTVLGTMTAPITNEDARAAIPEMVEVFEAEGIQSTMDVPFQSATGLRGSLGIAFTQRHTFAAEEERLYRAIAERAAAAIDNAELYERAQQAASLEERQRLARELHDSVSQALYGIALGARTARAQLDREPARAVEPVEYVMSLAEAGLAEMRALIFELRPESLQNEGLVAALEKQAASTRARFGLDVEAALGSEPDLPFEAKEALYRIAQEALHNVVKHAHATRAGVRLGRADGAVVMEVWDDGRGFDAGASYPGHVGLHSMRERVARIDGTLAIDSAPGQGSRISVTLRA